MKGFLWNILLALAWAALSGDFSPVNLIAGFVAGFVALYFLREVLGLEPYIMKAPRVLGLLAFFLWEVILANINVAYHVLTPKHLHRPGIISVPLDAETDVEITMLTSLLSLTPGSLALHVSDDKKALYVHCLDIDDPNEVRKKIKQGFERRVIEVMR